MKTHENAVRIPYCSSETGVKSAQVASKAPSCPPAASPSARPSTALPPRPPRLAWTAPALRPAPGAPGPLGAHTPPAWRPWRRKLIWAKNCLPKELKTQRNSAKRGVFNVAAARNRLEHARDVCNDNLVSCQCFGQKIISNLKANHANSRHWGPRGPKTRT